MLKERALKIVFAESCTGGLISAALTRIPGVSAYHCGSAVVYQVETKIAWLGVSKKTVAKHGVVSSEVAVEMARGALEHTPHADLAASVTGHLGPGAPEGQDGLMFAAAAVRRAAKRRPKVVVRKHLLDGQFAAQASGPKTLRIQRQMSAACYVLSLCADVLESL